MKERIRQIAKHPLISGSIVIFLGTLVANVGNFFFTIFMASHLSVSNYGILASLITLITLPGYAATALSPLINQFAGKAFAEGNIAKVNGLYRKITKFVFLSGFCFFLLFIVFINTIGKFFAIHDTTILVLTDFAILLSLFIIVNNSFIQAKLAFNFIGFISIITSGLKLFIGIALVLLGLSTKGAVSAIFLSMFIPYLLTFIPIKFIFWKETSKEKINTKDLLNYGIPAALASLALTSLISSDILLVKHFFVERIAGLYAGLSLLGRVVFFFTSPISMVMFPTIVQKYTRKESYTGVLFLSLLLVGLASIGMTVFYFLFPHFVIILFLKKAEYLSIASLLGLFAIFITVFSVLSVLVNFYLSIQKIKVVYPIFVAAISQIILIFMYHQSLAEIVYISLLISFLLLIVLLLYYPYATKKQ